MIYFEVDWVYVVVPLAFCLLDCTTGVIRGALKKELSSTKARQGLMHKASFLLVIVLGVALQCASQIAALGFEIPSMPAICAYIVLTECMSIVENIIDMNPELANSGLFKFFKGGDE